MKETLHVPVLLQEAVDGLSVQPGAVVVDATIGGGGHTREILKRVLPKGLVIAFDADKSALEKFREAARSDEFLTKALAEKSLILVHKNYSFLGGVLEDEGIKAVDAILADLGFSSDQIENGERGFSFQKSGPLDMRLDQETELTADRSTQLTADRSTQLTADRSTQLTADRSTQLTAETIVNTFSLEEIEKILREYGDESESRRIARAIIVARGDKPFATTGELASLIEDAYPKGKRYRMKIHPATKTFQALRIAVNREFEHLEQFLLEAVKHLRLGGRLAVITFHSGEDRIVSQFFKSQARGCVCPPGFPVCRCGQKPILKILTKKPIIPSDQEVQDNPRSRSAKLRIAQRI